MTVAEVVERLAKRASEIEAHVKKYPNYHSESQQHAADLRYILERLATSQGDLSARDLGPTPQAKDASEGLPGAPGYPLSADPSTIPPPHWTPQDQYDRHPKRAEDWNWRNDVGMPERLDLVVRRLNFAGDLADPRAPDQMALVLRKDLIDLKHDWLRKDAVFQIWKAERAAKAGNPVVPDEAQGSPSPQTDSLTRADLNSNPPHPKRKHRERGPPLTP